MADRRQIETWTGVARGLHWMMALLILLQAVVGWVGADLERSPLKIDVLTAHKSLGITLLLLVVMRLIWRWAHPAPPPPDSSKQLEIWVARLSHAMLYLLMITLPLTGWLSASTSIVPWKFWWVIPWPDIAAVDENLHAIAEEIHEGLVWCLVGILALHVAAALWHHFAKRDRVLLRMLRGEP